MMKGPGVSSVLGSRMTGLCCIMYRKINFFLATPGDVGANRAEVLEGHMVPMRDTRFHLPEACVLALEKGASSIPTYFF